MKVKRVLPLVLSLLMAGGAFAGLAGCNKGDGNNPEPPPKPEHQHSYTGWHDNGDGTHSPECTNTTGTCDAPVKTSEKEDHDYGSGTACTKCGAAKPTSGGEASTPLPAGNKIYVVGDSTVCSFSDSYYLPRYGYGTQLAEYLNVTSDQIVNLALSGRSSKSFLTENNYTTLKTSISDGDYLIIGFGHNDEKSAEPARFTDPAGTITEETTAKGTSLQYCLYQNYIKLANDKGATPILCTPITRYDDKGEYTGSKVHVTSDGDYAAAIKKLGEDTQTAVIDLTKITADLYKANNAEAKYFHAHTSYEGAPVTTITGTETPSGRDDTHINKFGAKMVAYQFANALKSTDCALKAHVKDDMVAPTKAVDYADAINKNYVKPNYKPFDPANTTAVKLTDNWYATKMGKLGIAVADSTCSATYSNNTFTVGETDVKSKFESGADGFAAAFMQVDISKNFTISANIKVKTVNSGLSNSQGGFGIMLRDDILVDTREDTLSSNYVAAGLLNKKAPIFSRESGTLASSGSSNAIAANDTHTVSIERVGQSVVVKFDTTTKTFTDFDFVAVDNNYMYICLFANRGLVVEFTNVQFEITGESQGA